MTLFQTLTKNGSMDFSDFLYGVRGDDYLTFCENRMSKKFWFSSYGPKMAKNGPDGSPLAPDNDPNLLFGPLIQFESFNLTVNGQKWFLL